MSTEIEPIREQNRRPSALMTMAARYDVEPAKLLETLKATVFKGATNEQLMALVIVANEFRLNPFTRELYAFSDSKSGGIVPVIGIDGWLRRINEHPEFDGMEHVWIEEEGKPVACTCTIYRKDRSRSISVTEYMEECRRNTEPWNKSPRRMLRHRATIQCARVAFGFGGGDEDETTERVVTGRDVPLAQVPKLLSGEANGGTDAQVPPLKPSSRKEPGSREIPDKSRRKATGSAAPDSIAASPEPPPSDDLTLSNDVPEGMALAAFWRQCQSAGLDAVAVMGVLRDNGMTEGEFPADLAEVEAFLALPMFEKLVELVKTERRSA